MVGDAALCAGIDLDDTCVEARRFVAHGARERPQRGVRDRWQAGGLRADKPARQVQLQRVAGLHQCGHPFDTGRIGLPDRVEGVLRSRAQIGQVDQSGDTAMFRPQPHDGLADGLLIRPVARTIQEHRGARKAEPVHQRGQPCRECQCLAVVPDQHQPGAGGAFLSWWRQGVCDKGTARGHDDARCGRGPSSCRVCQGMVGLHRKSFLLQPLLPGRAGAHRLAAAGACVLGPPCRVAAEHQLRPACLGKPEKNQYPTGCQQLARQPQRLQQAGRAVKGLRHDGHVERGDLGRIRCLSWCQPPVAGQKSGAGRVTLAWRGLARHLVAADSQQVDVVGVFALQQHAAEPGGKAAELGHPQALTARQLAQAIVHDTCQGAIDDPPGGLAEHLCHGRVDGQCLNVASGGFRSTVEQVRQVHACTGNCMNQGEMVGMLGHQRLPDRVGLW